MFETETWIYFDYTHAFIIIEIFTGLDILLDTD